MREIDAGKTCQTTALSKLMEQLRSGDSTALAHLYDATAGKVYARALRVTGNPGDAEQVTGDVYRQLWQTASKFNPRNGAPLDRIMDLARNRALDCVRKRHAQRESFEAIHQLEAGAIFSPALSNMNPLQAWMIALAIFDGLSYREIADCAHLPPGALKAQLCQALLLLQRAPASASHTDAKTI